MSKQDLMPLTNRLRHMMGKLDKQPDQDPDHRMVMNEWFTESGEPIPVQTRIPDTQRQEQTATLDSISSVNFPQVRLELKHPNEQGSVPSSRPHWLTRLVRRLVRPLQWWRERHPQQNRRQTTRI